MDIEILIRGIPVPKQSFRISGHGGYRDPRVTEWQRIVTLSAISWMNLNLGHIHTPLFEQGTEVDVCLDFYLPDKRRVDLDNLSKAVLDALNGYLWADDRQIVRMVLTKIADVGSPAAGVLIKVRGL